MLEITYRKLKGILPYAKNSRTHSAASVSKIAGSLREFGWAAPMLVADNVMIAGHARLLAALQMAEAGLDIPGNPDPWMGPTVDISHLSKHQRAAYVIADNRLALDAGWDQEILAEELGWLYEDEFNLDIIGFEESELAGLLAGLGPGATAGEDDIPETPMHPVTGTSDVWLLGDGHRLVCGDSTNPDHVAALMQGKLADLCFTSPPYVNQRDYINGIGDWDTLMQGVFTSLPMTPEAQVLVNLGIFHRDDEWQPYWYAWIDWMRTVGWRRFGWYVWDKGWGAPGDWHGHLAPSHEFIFHFNRVSGKAHKTKAKDRKNVTSGLLGKQRTRHKDGSTRPLGNQVATTQPNKIPDSVLRINRQVGSVDEGLGHPAVFPVALVDEIVTAFSETGDIVFEPFCGSGTSIISADKNGRKCYGIEISPQYVDVAVKRFQTIIGVDAILESTGKTYTEMALERPFGLAVAAEALVIDSALAEEAATKPRRTRKRA